MQNIGALQDGLNLTAFAIFQLGEVIIRILQEGLQLLLRGGKTALFFCALIQIRDQRLRTFGQSRGVFIDVSVESVAPFRFQFRGVRQNTRGRADRRHGGNHLMQGGGKIGVMGQPIGQGFHCPFQLQHPAVAAGQQLGPARITTGKSLGRFFNRGGTGIGGTRLPKRGQHRRFGAFGQDRRLHPQHFGQRQEEFSADSASVMFDQIEI